MPKQKKTPHTIISPRKKPDWVEQFRCYLTQVSASPLTVRGYLTDLTLFATWFKESRGEKFSPQAITPLDLRDYKSYLMTVKASKPATVNRKLIAVSRFCRWAQSAGLISDNPAEEIKLQKIQRLAPKGLSRPEQHALIRAVEKNGAARDAAVIHLLLGAGLRLSELANLQRSDVDLSERKGWVRVRMGKGMKTREIPLNRDARKALEDYFATFDGKEDAALFSGQRGSLTAEGIREIVKKYAYQAKLEHCSPHTLRHTFGKNLVDTGTPLDQVALLLGHESLDTTKIYTAPSSADLQKAIERISVSES
jgi:site-specific recombinase XerD